MERSVAIAINGNVEAAMSSIFSAADILRPRMSDEDFKIYSDMLGEVMHRLDPGVLEWVYRYHPDLRPSDLSPIQSRGSDA